MAITISKTENELRNGATAYATHTFRVDIGDIVVNDTSDQSLNNYVSTPANGYGKYNTAANGRNQLYQKFYFKFYLNGNYIRRARYTNYAAIFPSVSANVEAAIPRTAYWWDTTVKPSDYFNSSDKTIASVPISYTLEEFHCETDNSSVGTLGRIYSNTESASLGTINLRLNVPPTFNTTVLSLDTTSAYANVTTASVTVSNTTAYYGGDISSVTLTIGQQTASISGDGTLSIALDTVGTFTPVVSVTDSRGQVGSQTLDPLVVNAYSSPTVNFTADRTTGTGTPDDEGTYATLDATFVFSDVIASLIAPSVVLTDENGTQTTPTVTWYSSRAADGTLSGSVTWANLSTGDTVYGLVPGLNTNYSYQVSVRPRDNRTTGTAIIQTVSSAFYTIDFLAGGHGIAFGQPASTTGFVCNMTTTFNDTVAFGDDADFGADIFIELPDYQVSSTTDKAIYDAIVALGWDSDVLS